MRRTLPCLWEPGSYTAGVKEKRRSNGSHAKRRGKNRRVFDRSRGFRSVKKKSKVKAGKKRDTGRGRVKHP